MAAATVNTTTSNRALVPYAPAAAGRSGGVRGQPRQTVELAPLRAGASLAATDMRREKHGTHNGLPFSGSFVGAILADSD